MRNLQGHGEKHLYQHSVSSCRSFQLLRGVACLSLIGNEQRNGQKDRDHEQNNLVEPLHHLMLLPSRVCACSMSRNCHVLFQIMHVK